MFYAPLYINNIYIRDIYIMAKRKTEKRNTEKRKRRNNRKNYSRKGGMVSRGIFHTVPTKPNLFSISGKNKVKQQEQSDEPELSDEQIMMFEENIINFGIKFIRDVFEKNNMEKMLKPGWKKFFRKLVNELYLEEKNKLNTLQGGVGSDALTVPKPKFAATNYIYILVSIVFGIASIFFMASFYSSVESILKFNISDKINDLQISEGTKEILCNAFKEQEGTEEMNAMARMWYAMSCFFASSRPDSVIKYETKMFNIIQSVLTNAIVATAKQSTNICIGETEGFIGFANKFSAFFTQGANCLVEVSTATSQHNIQEIQYIMTVLKSSLLRKGYDIYIFPTMMLLAGRYCKKYLLKYNYEVSQFHIKDAKYNNSIQGNPTDENVIPMGNGPTENGPVFSSFFANASNLPRLIKDSASNTSNNASAINLQERRLVEFDPKKKPSYRESNRSTSAKRGNTRHREGSPSGSP